MEITEDKLRKVFRLRSSSLVHASQKTDFVWLWNAGWAVSSRRPSKKMM